MGNLAAFLGTLLDSWRIRRLSRAEQRYIDTRNALEAGMDTVSNSRYWRLGLKANAAFKRWEHLLRCTPRYWRIGLSTGGRVELGKLTRIRALEEATKLHYQVRYIDDEHAFLFVGDTESESTEK